MAYRAKPRKRGNIEKEYLRKVAIAAYRRRPIPPHPAGDGRIAKAGGLEAWIKQSPARGREIVKCLKALAKGDKIEIPTKNRIWPAELRSVVKGYQRPKSDGGDTIKPSPLSAGTPGNEESDPGKIQN
jgi:hypothetical protein